MAVGNPAIFCRPYSLLRLLLIDCDVFKWVGKTRAGEGDGDRT